MQETVTDDVRKAEAAWTEIQRRDGNAVWHSWQWMRAFFVVLAVWVCTAGVGLWLYAHSRDVEVVVQTVVYDKDGHFASLGVPQKLLDYEAEDGQWRDMLGEWVHKFRWRTDETEPKLADYYWTWLFAHTCGQAATELQAAETRERAVGATKVVRSVKDRTITKTPTPHSFQVLWEETTVDRAQSTKEQAAYTGTFTVGRTKPRTAAEAADNALGLCVTSYDIRKHH